MRYVSARLVAFVLIPSISGTAIAGVAETAWLAARSGLSAPGSPGYSFYGLLADNGGTALPAPTLCGDLVLVGSSLRQGSATPLQERGLWLLGASNESRLLARQGHPAPGTEAGTFFQTLNAVTGGANGRALFAASLGGPLVDPAVNAESLWEADLVGTTIAARAGQLAPGTSPVGSFVAFSGATVFDGTGGQLRVNAYVESPEGEPQDLPFTRGTWVREGANFGLAYWSFGPAPDITGALLNETYESSGPLGPGAFCGRISGPAVGSILINGVPISNNWCVWRTDAGERHLIARTATAAPGTPSGVVFSTLANSLILPAVNARGDVVFSGMLAGTGTTSANRSGLWRANDEGVALLVRAGSPATAAGTGVVFDALSVGSTDGSLALMNNGDAVFCTYFAGTGVNLSNCRGIYKRSPSGVDTLIARAGVSNPALPSGTTLVRTMLPRAMKAAGDDHVMFTAQLSGTGVTTSNDDVLLRHTAAGGLQVLAREGTTIGSHILKSYVNNGADMQITASGFAAVPAMFSPASNPSATPVLGVLGVSPSGVARVLAVQNHNIALSDGTFPVIGQLRIAPKSAISEDGRVAMAASFGSGTPRDEGVFVVTIDSGFVPPAPCLADYNNSGSVTSQDIFDFLTDWFLGNADFDQSGVTEVTDIFAYFSVYFAGCD